jgi:hypothetical protein
LADLSEINVKNIRKNLFCDLADFERPNRGFRLFAAESAHRAGHARARRKVQLDDKVGFSDVIIFLNIFAQKFSEKIGVFTQSKLK